MPKAIEDNSIRDCQLNNTRNILYLKDLYEIATNINNKFNCNLDVWIAGYKFKMVIL